MLSRWCARVTIIALGLWLGCVRDSQASLTTVATQETFRAYDFPRNDDHPAPGLSAFSGHLLLASVDENCHIQVDDSKYPSILGNNGPRNDSLGTILAYVDMSNLPSIKCRRLVSVLEVSQGLESIDALVFASIHDSDTDFGGLDDINLYFYREALPIPQFLLAVGQDTGQSLLRQLTEHPAPEGISVTGVWDDSPWTVLAGSVGFLFVRWLFFAIRVLAALYVTYHMFTMYRLSCFRYSFKFLVFTAILVHLVAFMIGPLELYIYRYQAWLFLIGWFAVNAAFYALILRWARVVRSIYPWKWLRFFTALAHVAFYAVFITLFFTGLNYFTLPSREFVSDFGNILRTYVVTSLTAIQSVFFTTVGLRVVFLQWRQYRSDPGAMALIKLTLLCLFSMFGWLLLSLVLVLIQTVWAVPDVKTYLGRIICSHIASLLAVFAVFWNMTVSGVDSHSSDPSGQARTSLGGRLGSVHLQSCNGHLVDTCASTPRTSRDCVSDVLEKDCKNPLSEKPVRLSILPSVSPRPRHLSRCEPEPRALNEDPPTFGTESYECKVLI
ncbi:hypothetical protein H4R33_001089 [Dimargaris cristalligena]|nr:hypothetical protein H4R33_001089 [Dimargaris cristalligena]